MSLARCQKPISFVNYCSSRLLGLLLGLLLVMQNLAAQEPEDTSAEEDAEQSSSLAASSEPEAPPYESRAMRDRTLIANALQDESVWLDTDYGKILAMHRITEARSTYGVLVLLHAAEDPQHWPPALENLRTHLPRYGWETLAIALPQKTPRPIPARPSSSSSSSQDNSENADAAEGNAETIAESVTEATPEEISAASSASNSSSSSSSSVSRELLIAAYIDAALKYLNEKNQFNLVVLTDNSSAYLSLSKLLPMIQQGAEPSDTIDGPLQALIIGNLQPQESLSRSELEIIFSIPQLPVMDVFFAPDSAAQQAARNLHRATAMRQKVTDYQQLSLAHPPMVSETDFQSFLLGRVRGFMQRKASGVELKQEARAAQQSDTTTAD